MSEKPENPEINKTESEQNDEQNLLNSFLNWLKEWLIAIALGLALFAFLRTFVFRLADVNGSSMEPTLSHGDFILLDRTRYLWSSPRIGDMIAFPFAANPQEYFMKRIIGVPGDVIDFNGVAFTSNGVPYDYWFEQSRVERLGDVVFPIVLKEDQYFVIGDNINVSQDSRFTNVGLISSSDMIGRAVFRIWPLSRFGRIEERR